MGINPEHLEVPQQIADCALSLGIAAMQAVEACYEQPSTEVR